MKKLLTLLLSVLLFVSGLTEAEGKTVKKYNPNKNSHVVYYIPHQDDEALSMGLSILNHMKTGHNVHIVLLTDGSASNIRKKLNMSEKDFTNARNKEFALSLKSMGVKSSNVEYVGYKDSQLTVANVEKVIKKYENKYPKAKHKTFSWTDSANHDHSNAGKALKNLQRKGVVTDARYYVRRGDNPKGLKLIAESYDKSYKPKVMSITNAYKVEDSKRGMYGIGYKSVKKSFQSFKNQPLSRYHR